VVIQAGQSGRGRRFAGRWAEVVFTSAPTLASARTGYADVRAEIAAAGRDPNTVKICNLVMPVVGASRAEAEDKMAVLSRLPLEIDQLSLLSEALNFDFSLKGLDEPMSDAELAGLTGQHTHRDRTVALSGKANPTPRDFITITGRGAVDQAVVGSAREIADHLESYIASGACDGFVIAATHVPGAYADFVEHVVPELQRRGLFHQDYEGQTLRENLGLTSG
jgi:alkanesulfonate monooxygenase SsuD/methylene tetrahydromethanopterin reductase-like flavin-dependent oxidoreductase (luciferase family)